MTTNSQIKTAFFARLATISGGYTIAWPGVNFTPPGSGAWLEASHFPIAPLDEGLANDSSTVPRGIFQVSCVTRPGLGTAAIDTAAQAVIALFPKGRVLSGSVRVVRAPYSFEAASPSGDKIEIAVTVEYSG